jgi:valyl-tRNA synthetase
MVGTDEFAVPVGDLIDVKAEIEKAEKELQHLEGFLMGVRKKLGNENFVAHAPEAVIARERKK